MSWRKYKVFSFRQGIGFLHVARVKYASYQANLLKYGASTAPGAVQLLAFHGQQIIWLLLPELAAL